jgi:hypothetical protein
MDEARKKQAKRKKIVDAAQEKIENVGDRKTKITKIDDRDVKLTVPYRIATTLNQNINLRRSQNNIRKQLCVFVEHEFDTFVDDFRKITDPAIRARLHIEIIKMIIPRAKDFSDYADESKNIYKRLFGKQNENDA